MTAALPYTRINCCPNAPFKFGKTREAVTKESRSDARSARTVGDSVPQSTPSLAYSARTLSGSFCPRVWAHWMVAAPTSSFESAAEREAMTKSAQPSTGSPADVQGRSFIPAPPFGGTCDPSERSGEQSRDHAEPHVRRADSIVHDGELVKNSHWPTTQRGLIIAAWMALASSLAKRP